LHGSGSFHHPAKKGKKDFDFYWFMTSLGYFLSLKTNVNVPSKSKKQQNFEKNLFLLKATDEKSRIRIWSLI
jgi:hypothetical protein